MTNIRIAGFAHVFGPDINTDVHCSSKYMPGRDSVYVAQHAFEQVAPDFGASFRFGDLIIAGRNFGINSSREQAIQVMRLLGVSAVVAPSFGRQFFRNAINNGLPLIECDTAGIVARDKVEVDFNDALLRVTDRCIRRPITRMPATVQSLLAAGGLVPFLQSHPEWVVH
ncbi:MAG: hypothetical protein KIT13_03565 [Burkholderiales bacterium]|nr:hypothetical protein [Burkholderiales bacterium]